MSDHFKATRPDGTDFRTGTVDYAAALASGERVTVRKPENGRRLCGPGVLHAATVPAETLVGGSWPCRLFAVTGRPLPLDSVGHSHKRGFASLRVVRELPAWQALGPNGESVAALIDRAGRLTPAEADAAASAWAAARAAARDAAWAAAGSAARYAARALVVRDLITPEQFDLLYGPWASVIEVSP